MRLSRNFVGTLAVLFALCIASTAYGQICTGDGQCVVEINGVQTNLGTNVELGWSNGAKTEKTQISIMEYKELSNSAFTMELDPDKTSRLIVLSDDCENLFPGSVTVEVYGIISYQGENYTSEDGSALVLDSEESVESWPPDNGVCYSVRNDVTYTNGGETIVVRAGSTICMN